MNNSTSGTTTIVVTHRMITVSAVRRLRKDATRRKKSAKALSRMRKEQDDE